MFFSLLHGYSLHSNQTTIIAFGHRLHTTDQMMVDVLRDDAQAKLDFAMLILKQAAADIKTEKSIRDYTFQWTYNQSVDGYVHIPAGTTPSSILSLGMLVGFFRESLAEHHRAEQLKLLQEAQEAMEAHRRHMLYLLHTRCPRANVPKNRQVRKEMSRLNRINSRIGRGLRPKAPDTRAYEQTQ